jgi:hypothetical protein
LNRPTEPANGQHTANGQTEPMRYMEIGGVGLRRKVWGWTLYLLLFAGVSALLVFVFVKFTASLKLAITLVVFMVAYMAFMGWWASRNDENLDTRRGDEMRDPNDVDAMREE